MVMLFGNLVLSSVGAALFVIITQYKAWQHLDSEWHTFFACPYTEKVRRRFRLALSSSGLGITLDSDWNLSRVGDARIPDLHDLAVFVAQCRMHRKLVAELARFQFCQ